MTYQKRKKMTDGMAGAFFTVEAAILYPLVLAVIVLMVYLLFFNMIVACWIRISERRQFRMRGNGH